MKKHDLALIIMGIAVVGVSITAIVLNGSPLDNRALAQDQQRYQTIQRYKANIENFYSLEKRLPQSLVEAQSALSSVQPEIDESIEYQITNEREYQLCATFNNDDPNAAYMGAPDPRSGIIKTTYKKGYDCLIYQIPEYVDTKPLPVPVR